MTGQHAGPSKDRVRRYLVWPRHGAAGETQMLPAPAAPAPAWPHPAALYADLGACVVFRDTVRSVYVRSEPLHNGTPAGGTWAEQYAATFANRTSLPPDTTVYDYGVAEAADAAMAAVAADYVRAHRDVFGDCVVVDAQIDDGFWSASRWFHSAATAGFPAVAA